MRLVGLAVVALFLTFTSHAALAADDCDVQINDRTTYTRSDPVEADPNETLHFSGRAPAGTTVRIDLEFDPVPWPIVPRRDAGGAWTADVRPFDFVSSVGLYHVRAHFDPSDKICDGWILVTGDPLSTTVGRIAAATFALGVFIQLIAALRRSRWSLLGGVPTGIGLAVLLQQYGIVPLNVISVAACCGSAMAIGAVPHAFGRAATRVRIPESPPKSAPGSVGAEPRSMDVPTRATAPAGASAPTPTAASAGMRGADGAGATGGAAPPSATSAAETPERSYALMRCPDTVVAEIEFELELGLSPEPLAEVAYGVVVRPKEAAAGYTLTIQLVADGFELRAGETWRNDVTVTPNPGYPHFTLHLTAEAQHDDLLQRTLQAFYSIGGQPVGFGAREVRVARTADLASVVPPVAQQPTAAMTMPEGVTPDLVVQIAEGKSESDGRFRLILQTPHPVKIPDQLPPIDLGDKPEQFARDLALECAKWDGHPDLYLRMVGIGKRVADQLPGEFWDVLRAIYQHIGRKAPTILISTADPYVPWELAVLEPPLDDTIPPFLGAQAVVGRWVPGRGTPDHPGRPPLMPPQNVQVTAIAVVNGVYERKRLVDAELEAEVICTTYKGIPVNAVIMDVLRCVSEGDPRAELLHFALHGEYDREGTHEGLVLVDDEMLVPDAVMGATLKWHPFVFLNACQVGTGQRVLGDYAGMAQAFLRAGASAVIAPLWSVRNETAREIAVRFYARTFGGASPAEALREERARFTNSSDTVTATFLAYQYFGHPIMKMSRTSQ